MIAIEREQVEKAAIAGRERRHLAIDGIAAEARPQLDDAAAHARFEPSLRLQAKECVGVGAIGTTALEQTGKELAAQRFVFRRERRFVGAGANGYFVLASEGRGRGSVTHACEFEAMQQKPDFARRARADFDASTAGFGNEAQQPVNSGLAPLESRRRRKCVHEA